MAAPRNEYGITMAGARLQYSRIESTQNALIEAVRDNPEAVAEAIEAQYAHYLDQNNDGVVPEARLQSTRDMIQGGQVPGKGREGRELESFYVLANATLDKLETELTIKTPEVPATTQADATPVDSGTRPNPLAAEGTSVTSDGDVITVKLADGTGLLLDYSFSKENWVRDSNEYGFTLRTLDGDYKHSEKLDSFGMKDVVSILKDNQSAIQAEMGKILENRLRVGDGEIDNVEAHDFDRVLKNIASPLEVNNNRIGEVVDAMSVLALRDAAGNFQVNDRDEFLTKINAKPVENAAAVLEAANLSIGEYSSPEAVGSFNGNLYANDEYVFRFDLSAIPTAQHVDYVANNMAEIKERLETIIQDNIAGGKTIENIESRLKDNFEYSVEHRNPAMSVMNEIALGVVEDIKNGVDLDPTITTERDVLAADVFTTLLEKESLSDFTNQSEHYREHGQFYGDISPELAKAIALDAVLVTRDEVAQQSFPAANRDTMTHMEAQQDPKYIEAMSSFANHDPASDPIPKVTVETVSVTGSISQTLNSAIEVTRQPVALDSAADIETIQLLLSAANIGGYEPLNSAMGDTQPNGRALEISKVDGIRGWRTNGTLAATLGKDINDLGSSEAELASLQAKIISDPKLLNAIQLGLPQALQGIDPAMRANMTQALNNFTQTNTEANAAPVDLTTPTALAGQFSQAASIDLASDDRVIDSEALENAQEAVQRWQNENPGQSIPESGILSSHRSGLLNTTTTPILVRELNGELIIHQLHDGNASALLQNDINIDPKIAKNAGYALDRKNDTDRYDSVPKSIYTDGIRFEVTKDGRNGIINFEKPAFGGKDTKFSTSMVQTEDGKSTLVQTEGLIDALEDHNSARDLKGAFAGADSSLRGVWAKNVEMVEEHLEANAGGDLNITFDRSGQTSYAMINTGSGEPARIPEELLNKIIEQAKIEGPSADVTAQANMSTPMG